MIVHIITVRYKGLEKIHVGSEGDITFFFNSPFGESFSRDFGKNQDGTPRATVEQVETWVKGDLPIQRAMPQLSAEEREMFITGFSLVDQAKLFGESK